MKNLIINEMTTGSYMERTQFNANKSDFTIACAIDYTTAGEKFTKKVAGEHYLALPLSQQALTSARQLYKALEKKESRILNLAGNSMYTLSTKHITQRRVNIWVHDVLSLVHMHLPIQSLKSGGQSGVDIAAAVVGPLLNIPTEINFPKGYKHRLASGLDVLQTLDDVMLSIEEMQLELLADLKASA